MSKGLFFFCCACCILVLTIINLSVGPIVSKTLENHIQNNNNLQSLFGIIYGSSFKLGTLNCEYLKDTRDDLEESSGSSYTDQVEKTWTTIIDQCTRTKGMHDMEYTAFIFDIVIGFVCGLMGLLHLFDLKKDFVSNTGLIGLICGVIGFIFTFVYVIFNGIVFTSNYTGVYERDGDGAFAEQSNGNTYKCLYGDDSGDFFAGFAKFSDLNKKQYNYKHEFYGSEATGCTDTSTSWIQSCRVRKEYFSASLPISTCGKLYAKLEDGITNKDIFDRFLTTLILSLIVCLANIGLALFGFLLFRTPGDF